VSDLHMYLGIGVLIANAVAGGWGAVAWVRKQPSIAFWPLLRIAQAVVVVQVVLGLLLVASGESAPDGLHIVYGVTPLVVSLVTEGMRIGAAQKELEGIEDVQALERRQQVAIAHRVALSEMGVMTVGLLLILTLALRAYQTGG
jgi:heme A synthase